MALITLLLRRYTLFRRCRAAAAMLYRQSYAAAAVVLMPARERAAIYFHAVTSPSDNDE